MHLRLQFWDTIVLLQDCCGIFWAMSVLAQVEGGARGRTRKAILDAAMTVLADNPAAPLSDIATAAEVGRSTVHRYFAERIDLIRALALHVHALSNAAIEHGGPDCGPPVEALRRVVECQLDLGPDRAVRL